MKKKYFKPVMDVYDMQLQCTLLAGSNPNQKQEYDYPEDDEYYDGPLG